MSAFENSQNNKTKTKTKKKKKKKENDRAGEQRARARRTRHHRARQCAATRSINCVCLRCAPARRAARTYAVFGPPFADERRRAWLRLRCAAVPLADVERLRIVGLASAHRSRRVVEFDSPHNVRIVRVQIPGLHMRFFRTQSLSLRFYHSIIALLFHLPPCELPETHASVVAPRQTSQRRRACERRARAPK